MPQTAVGPIIVFAVVFFLLIAALVTLVLKNETIKKTILDFFPQRSQRKSSLSVKNVIISAVTLVFIVAVMYYVLRLR